MLPNFFYHPATLDYDFGPRHPLKPERMRRTLRLLDRLAPTALLRPDPAGDDDLQRVHTAAYLEAIRQIDAACASGASEREDIVELRRRHGFFGDNPPFAGMEDASRAYCGATIAAARAVRDGASLAYGIGGGLHHAMPDRASGFCLLNDPAIAVSILRERFDRVAYVDIDVHHGDGVQWIWYDDPTVLTCSIHEDGRTLWPGTGGVEETGAAFTSLNVPLRAKTTGDVWLAAFNETILPALQIWRPNAIVLQMGTDTHFLDPLGHLMSTQQEWIAAVAAVRDLGVPVVALGGGGYNLSTVPRMWVSACLTLAGIAYEDLLPTNLADDLEAETFSDPLPPATFGEAPSRDVVRHIASAHLPNLDG